MGDSHPTTKEKKKKARLKNSRFPSPPPPETTLCVVMDPAVNKKGTSLFFPCRLY
jgi:hypothetical protein